MNIEKPLKIGFLGGSINSAIGYTHYIASQMDNLFLVESGCFSQCTATNNQTAAKWGIANDRIYGCWQDFLASEKEKLDAVVILTPTPNHYEMIMQSLDYGFAVITEKALAVTYEEGQKIAEKVRAQNAFLAVTYNYTGYPMLRELQQMIADNKLGNITHISIEMPQEGFARLNADGEQPNPQGWRLRDGKIPSVSLDLGVHLQHLVYFLTQQNPSEIVADQASFGWFDDIIDQVFCIARYPNGMRSQIWYGKSSIGHRNGLRIRIHGTQASAEWFQLQPEELLFNQINGSKCIIDRASSVTIANNLRYNRFKSGHPAGFIEAFANLYTDLSIKLWKYIKNGKNLNVKCFYDADTALKGLEISHAINVSSLKDKWIYLDADETHI